MSKRPGTVDVITEVGYCNFCGRTRNLRREQHRLGNMVRTIVTCETCHRTLTTSMGVATDEPEREAVTAADNEPEAAREPRPAAKAAAKPAAAKPATAKSARAAASTKATKSSKPAAAKPKPAAAKPKPATKAAVKANPRAAAKAPAKPKSSRSTTSRRTAR